MCAFCGDQKPSATWPRRRFLQIAGLAAAGVAFGRGSAWAKETDLAGLPKSTVGPAQAWERLLEGNVRYAEGKISVRDFNADRAALAKGQAPFAAILSCSDSRVAPELAFDVGRGEIFVVRVAGNFVSREGLASLEFATQVLGSSLILVLGHTSCGAIRATLDVIRDNAQLPGALPDLIASLRPGIEPVAKNPPAGDLLEAATKANVVYNMEQLKKSELIAKSVRDGKVNIMGAIYDLATGKVNRV